MLGQVITGAISLIFIAHSYWKTPPPSNTAEIRVN
jgi:hypothetical protein